MMSIPTTYVEAVLGMIMSQETQVVATVEGGIRFKAGIFCSRELIWPALGLKSTASVRCRTTWAPEAMPWSGWRSSPISPGP